MGGATIPTTTTRNSNNAGEEQSLKRYYKTKIDDAQVKLELID
jgi:hypothetical protein